MATSLAPDAKHEDWTERRAISAADPIRGRAEGLWTLLGLVLLGAFVLFGVVDSPLRAIIAGN
jgi:hypothetical protein